MSNIKCHQYEIQQKKKNKLNRLYELLVPKIKNKPNVQFLKQTKLYKKSRIRTIN